MGYEMESLLAEKYKIDFPGISFLAAMTTVQILYGAAAIFTVFHVDGFERF